MKKLLLCAVAVLMLAACNRQATFKINVNLANADVQTVYLQKAGQTLDSAVIDNWDAFFNTPVCDDQEMYAVMLNGWRRPFFFFTDHQEMTLEGDAQNPNAIVVRGSATQDRLVGFTQSLSDNDTVLKTQCFDYVCEHPTDPVAHYVLYRYKWAFTPKELREMIDGIHHADPNLVSTNLTMAEEYMEKLERVQPGQPVIDFTQNDPEGNPVTLSELAEGKLLLVDFWASWCPDCRRANPDVVAAYQRFHEQGFDVLGVSFDTDRERWLAAIEQDGLTWTQVSDLQGWNNAAGALYSIAFIPQNALLKDGMIVARNLEGEELQKDIEAQLTK